MDTRNRSKSKCKKCLRVIEVRKWMVMEGSRRGKTCPRVFLVPRFLLGLVLRGSCMTDVLAAPLTGQAKECSLS